MNQDELFGGLLAIFVLAVIAIGAIVVFGDLSIRPRPRRLPLWQYTHRVIGRDQPFVTSSGSFPANEQRLWELWVESHKPGKLVAVPVDEQASTPVAVPAGGDTGSGDETGARDETGDDGSPAKPAEPAETRQLRVSRVSRELRSVYPLALVGFNAYFEDYEKSEFPVGLIVRGSDGVAMMTLTADDVVAFDERGRRLWSSRWERLIFSNAHDLLLYNGHTQIRIDDEDQRDLVEALVVKYGRLEQMHFLPGPLRRDTED
ncbi:hypothetical protein C5E07_18670 [Pseudoclavibacter sp. RFBJ3]|uniref:hypothetical protein n=1 Tax=unclassified Pseudoclavibacter TaxID=2615177 RepID=UPI000CE7C953|nr:MULTISPECIES: hypothetical protein [unclassified Pseudoclavibacter]PPF79865.1 hypothetical protein C5C12_18785 [Pseudoclavibacter sp. RFBJ5]PPF88796.1 hypothetical protein C5E07_18670 [Pseudoclavibacter sp. RFBJ3]PPF93667.1 hypothetical protein C5C19_18815 [Pseudoclavibacter sp. RFBH5]PPG17932.1 hypothetical protein C5E13_18595 [Pseudoclavibacter sp. RFBI4]